MAESDKVDVFGDMRYHADRYNRGVSACEEGSMRLIHAMNAATCDEIEQFYGETRLCAEVAEFVRQYLRVRDASAEDVVKEEDLPVIYAGVFNELHG